MLSDGATLRQAAHQRHMYHSRPPFCGSGRCRESRKTPETRCFPERSGWTTHTLTRRCQYGKARKGGGLAGTGDSEDAFLGHMASGSCVYHDMGHSGSCFPGCREKAVNSEDPAAHCLLNPVKRMFAVHLRILRKNVPLRLNEKAFQREKTESMGFGRYLSFFYRRIFLSGKTLRRRDVFAL